MNILGHAPPRPGHTASADEAIEQEEDDKTAHAHTDANDKGFMVANPAPYGGALALAAIAFTAGVTGRAIQVVLEHSDTAAGGITPDTGGSATDQAAGRLYGIIAGPGIVGIEQAAHHGTALIVATRTLPTSTGEVTATRGSVIFELVNGAGAGVSCARLGNVAYTCAGSADSICGCILAFTATTVVGVVADGIILEFACLRVAARIITAALHAATIALFAGFDDAIAASTAADSDDSAIVGETG